MDRSPDQTEDNGDLIVLLADIINKRGIKSWSRERKEGIWKEALRNLGIDPEDSTDYPHKENLPRLIKEVYTHNAQRVLINSKIFASSIGVSYCRIDHYWDDVRAAAAVSYFEQTKSAEVM